MTTFQEFTGDYLKSKLLARVSDTVDKREGAIIYDTLAPTAEELAVYYTNLDEVQKQAYARTATGGFLDLIVGEISMAREKATYTIKKAEFKDEEDAPIQVPLNYKFSTISSDSTINYTVIGVYADEEGNAIPGFYKLKCDVAGTIGNGYTGSILPLSYIRAMATATMTDTLVPAQDEEDDETLRARFFAATSQTAFGGNLAQYQEYFQKIEGVACAQIYPVWAGGGTVKCSVIDASYEPLSADFINTVQTLIDPSIIDATPVTKGLGIGMAPIGHTVTIVTPEKVTLNIVADIALDTGYTIPQIQTPVDTAFEAYVLGLKKLWGIPNIFGQYRLTIYKAKLQAVLMNIPGILNVSSITINGVASDLVLTESSATQQLPSLGGVTLHVGS